MNEAPRVRVCAYDAQGLVENEIRDPDALIEFATNPATIWVDVAGVAGVNLLARLGEIFGLHSHLVQDLTVEHETSRLEDFGNSWFIALKTFEAAGWTSYPPLGATWKGTATEQVFLVVGEAFVLSFHQVSADLFENVREQLRQGRHHLRNGGASHLVSALLDAVVTSCSPLLHGFQKALEALEGDVARGDTAETPERIQGMRRSLIGFSHTAWSLRELLTLLVRVARRSPVLQKSRIYLREVRGRALRLERVLDSQRRLCEGLHEIYLSGVNLRTNQAIKLLALLGAVFLPLNFLVGFFGMNLASLRDLTWSPAWLLLLMAGVAALTVYWFRRRGWM